MRESQRLRDPDPAQPNIATEALGRPMASPKTPPPPPPMSQPSSFRLRRGEDAGASEGDGDATAEAGQPIR